MKPILMSYSQQNSSTFFHAANVEETARDSHPTHPSKSTSDYLKTSPVYIYTQTAFSPPRTFFTSTAPNNCPHIKCDYSLEARVETITLVLASISSSTRPRRTQNAEILKRSYSKEGARITITSHI